MSRRPSHALYTFSCHSIYCFASRDFANTYIYAKCKDVKNDRKHIVLDRHTHTHTRNTDKKEKNFFPTLTTLGLEISRLFFPQVIIMSHRLKLKFEDQISRRERPRKL